MIILSSFIAGGEAHAASLQTATPSGIPSSGIGLKAGLPRAGTGVLADSNYYNRALKSKLWVRTSQGMVFHSCVYNVPNGSHVDSIHGTITRPDGQSQPLTPCAYPRLLQSKQHSALANPSAASASPAGTNGWLQGFQEDALPPLGFLYGKYAVPNPPNQTASNLEDLAWSALAAGPGGNNGLLQPLIGWGYVGTLRNGTYTSNNSGLYMEMASYYFWSGNAVAASFQKVNPQDTIEMQVSATGCSSSGGGCTWLEYMFDDTNPATSEFTVSSSPAYTTLIGGMFESYNATNCNMLFANAHLVWRGLTVDKLDGSPSAGTPITPSFYRDVVDQECSMQTTYSSTSGDITWIR